MHRRLSGICSLLGRLIYPGFLPRGPRTTTVVQMSPMALVYLLHSVKSGTQLLTPQQLQDSGHILKGIAFMLTVPNPSQHHAGDVVWALENQQRSSQCPCVLKLRSV